MISGTTEAKRTDIADTFLDLGRNLFPDNLFQAAFQSVNTFSMFLTASMHSLTVREEMFPIRRDFLEFTHSSLADLCMHSTLNKVWNTYSFAHG